MKVVPALGAAAKAAREEAGVTPEEVSVALKEAGATTFSKDKLVRFEKGEHYAALDQTINVYARKLGVSVFDLWDEAIHRARKGTGEDNAADPPDESGTAVKPDKPKPKLKPKTPAEAARHAKGKQEDRRPKPRRQRGS